MTQLDFLGVLKWSVPEALPIFTNVFSLPGLHASPPETGRQISSQVPQQPGTYSSKIVFCLLEN